MSDGRAWFVLAVLGLALVVLYFLAPILTPFILSALLAYLGDPVADRLEAWKLSRTAAVVVVFTGLVVVILGALLLAVPVLQRQLTALISSLPAYLTWLQNQLQPLLEGLLGRPLQWPDPAEIERLVRSHWQQAGGLAAGVMASVSRSGLALLGWLANLVLIPVVTFYLLRDWDVLMSRLRGLLPRRAEPAIVRLAQEADEVLGAFLRGQLLVMLALGTLYALGLWLVGLDLAVLIGFVAGLVSFVPYLGLILGIVLAGAAALVQGGDLWLLVSVFVVFGIGQVLETALLTPWLVGDRIGLHPVAVIFAVMAGGQLFGFFGVLVALPVAAVVAVFLRHVHELYRDSALYQPEGGQQRAE